MRFPALVLFVVHAAESGTPIPTVDTSDASELECKWPSCMPHCVPCEKKQVGTCYMAGIFGSLGECSTWKGPTDCFLGKCLCKDGYCADGDLCKPQICVRGAAPPEFVPNNWLVLFSSMSNMDPFPDYEELTEIYMQHVFQIIPVPVMLLLIGIVVSFATVACICCGGGSGYHYSMDFSNIQHDQAEGFISGKTGRKLISDEEFARRAWKKRPACLPMFCTALLIFLMCFAGIYFRVVNYMRSERLILKNLQRAEDNAVEIADACLTINQTISQLHDNLLQIPLSCKTDNKMAKQILYTFTSNALGAIDDYVDQVYSIVDIVVPIPDQIKKFREFASGQRPTSVRLPLAPLGLMAAICALIVLEATMTTCCRNSSITKCVDAGLKLAAALFSLIILVVAILICVETILMIILSKFCEDVDHNVLSYINSTTYNISGVIPEIANYYIRGAEKNPVMEYDALARKYINQIQDYYDKAKIGLAGFGLACPAFFKLDVDDIAIKARQILDRAKNLLKGTCGGLVDLVIQTTDGPTDAEILDSGTIGLVAALFFVALMGMLFSLCCTGSCARLWFKPGPKQWTPANVMGILAVIIAVVAACCLPNSYKSTGIAAGLGTALTLVWSFFKLGAHDVLQMTREAAWRIHAVIGMLTLVVGIVHGVFAFIQVERQVFTEWHFLLGFIGLILMIFGVLPAHLVHYDKFKLIHFMSFWGYLLCFIHMIGHAVYLQSVAAIAVAGANGLALLLFFVQKIWVKATAGKVETKSLELVDETGGQHLFLNMHVPNFSFKAGQWGHLTVPSLGSVPHPFTLVPGDGDSNVRIFMKINRSGFTAKLAKACAGGTAPPMKLEGPHGLPCVPAKGMQRTVFVFGGVGITPGLSLAKAASDISGRKVALYWSLRSLELLKRAAPLLEPHLELSQSCVQLNGSGTQEGGTDLPLQAKYDLKDLYQWLDNVGQVYVKEGVSNAMVFVCGPPGLADAAKAAAKKSAGGIHWHVHVEEFLFLPSLSLGSKRPPTAPTPAKYTQ